MLAAPVKRVDEIAEESWIRLGDGAGGSSFVFYPEGSVADMGEKYHVVVGYLNEGTQVVRTCSTQGVNKVEASANPDISRTQGRRPTDGSRGGVRPNGPEADDREASQRCQLQG